MSVGDLLGIDENSELLDRARRHWPDWVEEDARLGVVDEFDDLRAWLPTVERDEADEVLLVLAMLAAPDGGDDLAAAAALAKCLLPGACRLAGWLSSLPPREVLRDSQPVQGGTWSAVERIDELVASQLWIEVRSFPWRRLRKVAANILMNTRAGVLRECGDFFHVARRDRTWANTTLVEEFAVDDVNGGTTSRAGRTLAHPALAHQGEEEPAAAEELLDLLSWACENRVISAEDRYLLLCLVDEASRVETRHTGRGYGGLLATELSVRVAPRVGMAQATVRRHAARSMRALADAAPARFSGVQ